MEPIVEIVAEAGMRGGLGGGLQLLASKLAELGDQKQKQQLSMLAQELRKVADQEDKRWLDSRRKREREREREKEMKALDVLPLAMILRGIGDRMEQEEQRPIQGTRRERRERRRGTK